MFRRLMTTLWDGERRHRDRTRRGPPLRTNDHLLRDIGLSRDELRDWRPLLGRP